MKDNIYLLEPNLSNIDDFSFELFYKLKLQDPNYHVNNLESDLEKFLNTEKKVCLLNSGTAALHLSLVVSGVSEDDIVFCSNSTFIATVNSILYVKANPYFVDIDISTGNMNMDYLEKAIIQTVNSGKQPKAIIITHSFGIPANMDKLLELKIRYNLILIEDAAEALGAKYHGRSCGVLADFGVLSFNSNKMNTCFGGGALIVKDDELKSKVKKYSTQYKGETFDFRHLKLAYNYRINDIAAYLGGIQMKNIYDELSFKKEIHQKYKNLLGDKLINVHDDNKVEPNYWLNCAKIPAKSFKKKYHQFLDEKIEVRRVWFPLNLQPYLKNYPLYGNNESKAFYESMICIPSSINLTSDEIKKISSIILNDEK